MRVLIREIRTINQRPDWTQILKAIEEKMEREVKPLALSYFDRVIKDWTLNIAFAARKRITKDEIVLYVYPTGDDAFIWKTLSITGSGLYGPKHAKYEIAPKNADQLSFVWGGPGSYQPKTYPIGNYSGPGTVRDGKLRHFMRVMHPGVEPRLFEVQIGKDLTPRFREIIHNAIRVGKRRAKGQSA